MVPYQMVVVVVVVWYRYGGMVPVPYHMVVWRYGMVVPYLGRSFRRRGASEGVHFIL